MGEQAQMSPKKSFDSISAIQAFAGQGRVTGEAIEVDQAMIDTFAGVTRDTQWIHTDPVRAAAESPFGGAIAHGLLTLSLVTGWFHRCFAFPNRKMALNYGFDRVRFTGPVKSGSKLVGSFALSKVEDVKAGEVRCFWQVEIHTQGATRPVMVAIWIMQVQY
jgi:acyl dehydratase